MGRGVEGEEMGTLDYRDIVMVAGQDPYSHKAVEDRTLAHVRPSGENGCVTGKQDDMAFRNE